MILRRQFLRSLAAAGLTLSGCKRMTAKNIDRMPHEFAMLTDPELRRRTLGNQALKISGADFVTLEAFYEATWENVHFYNCIVYGMTRLKLLRNCVFERCQFPGSNFQASDFEDELFLRSDTLNKAYLMAGKTSENVRFVACDFGRKNSDINQYGAIYFPNVSFERCTGQYMVVAGDGMSG